MFVGKRTANYASAIRNLHGNRRANDWETEQTTINHALRSAMRLILAQPQWKRFWRLWGNI
jgi:hypothetical protein